MNGQIGEMLSIAWMIFFIAHGVEMSSYETGSVVIKSVQHNLHRKDTTPLHSNNTLYNQVLDFSFQKIDEEALAVAASSEFHRSHPSTRSPNWVKMLFRLQSCT